MARRSRRWLSAQAVVGFYPANSRGDDIELYADESRTHRVLNWRNYRQQSDRPIVDGLKKPNRCLADFVAPKDSGIADYVGMFAVTAGIGIEKKLKEFEGQHDDYSSIMLKALADRLAEAFAERMHQRVRTELWGYASDEHLQNEDLIAEKYTGIRPAPGYPACPDHSVKEAMLPFSRFPDVDTALGPEMRSTGEVMGIDATFGKAFFKAELAAGTLLPTTGTVFLSLADSDKPAGLVVASRLRELGLDIAASLTESTRLICPAPIPTV